MANKKKTEMTVEGSDFTTGAEVGKKCLSVVERRSRKSRQD